MLPSQFRVPRIISNRIWLSHVVDATVMEELQTVELRPLPALSFCFASGPSLWRSPHHPCWRYQSLWGNNLKLQCDDIGYNFPWWWSCSFPFFCHKTWSAWVIPIIPRPPMLSPTQSSTIAIKAILATHPHVIPTPFLHGLGHPLSFLSLFLWTHSHYCWYPAILCI